MAPTDVFFEPLKLGDLVLKNKIIMSAMTRNRSSPTNVPTKHIAEYYKQRTSAGLLTSEGILITQQGSEWSNAPGIWSQEQIEAWKLTTEAVHKEGTPIFAQLCHIGRTGHPDMPHQKASGQPIVGPSAIAAAGGKFRELAGEPGYVIPTPIADPWTVVAEFKQAAINAKEAGFDGVEAHGASGHLIQQFLDSSANQRSDEWGGSPEKRAKFPLEVLKALVEVWGAGRVGIKLAPCGGVNDTGMPLEENIATYKHFITEANKLGLAYILLVRHYGALDPTNRGTPHDVFATYGSLVSKPTLLLGNAGYKPDEAAEAIAEGKIDGVVLGIMFIANPDLPKRIQFGKELNRNVNFASLYTHTGDEASMVKGFIDYPAAVY